jgi:hypothetical protein
MANAHLSAHECGAMSARADPVMVISYWRNDAAAHGKFVAEVCDGRCWRCGRRRFRFIGRDDDVIASTSCGQAPRCSDMQRQGWPRTNVRASFILSAICR